MMKLHNIFERLPEDLSTEVFETIVQSGQVKIERIISRGHASRPDDWYDQDLDEWVMLLKGRARLQFADSGRLVELSEGDYIHLPAHCRHRVDWTDPDQETIWLAVFFEHVR